MNEPGERTGVGYSKPPTATRFQKGRSGNPRGRPKNRKRGLPYDHVLGQMVTIRDNGAEKRVTAAEAFLLHLTKKGLEGDAPAARASLAALENARASMPTKEAIDILRVIIASLGPSLCLDFNRVRSENERYRKRQSSMASEVVDYRSRTGSIWRSPAYSRRATRGLGRGLPAEGREVAGVVDLSRVMSALRPSRTLGGACRLPESSHSSIIATNVGKCAQLSHPKAAQPRRKFMA